MTLEEFLSHPTKERWHKEINKGWRGPDGSSKSFDSIEGVRIGITSPSYKYSTLPANRHDWLYQLGRTLKLPSSYRKAADKDYRDKCIKRIDEVLIGYNAWKGRQRARVRYIALRLFGWTAWNK